MLTGTTSFKTALTKVVGVTTFYKFYYHQAPQVYPGTTTPIDPPYVVFDILPIDPDRDSASEFYRCTIQFLVASLALGDCENVAGYINDLLDVKGVEATITIGNYKLLEVRRAAQNFLGQIELVYNISIEYSIILQM
jgi:hypothetical protein